MIGRIAVACAAVALWLAADPSGAQRTAAGPVDDAAAVPRATASEPPRVARADGLLMLDYQTIPVRGGTSLDLLGFHVFSRLNDWAYLGVGGHAPLFEGEYGGFMAFDVTAHVRRPIFGKVFANAGVSLGGGGGGKSVQQSRVLSGTGGFVKTYAGLGYDFGAYSVGANIARMTFKDSAIDHSQLNVHVQLPFSYVVGAYASAGQRLDEGDLSDVRAATAGATESMLTLGLDNLFQVDPQGLNKGDIHLIELQYARFVTPSAYWYFNAGGGYRGRPLYNQAFGGMGYRVDVGPRLKLYGQLGIGSGGYAPETIDTGPGLLVYPRVAAEYLIDRNLGVSLSAGYVRAPRATSRNHTVGVSLNYHIHSGDNGPRDASRSPRFSGYRLHLYRQTESGVVYRGADQPDIDLLSLQIDSVLGRHLYIPVLIGAAYTDYLDLPGYGELLTGVGIQSGHRHGDDRFQFFGQLLVGANPHGSIFKTGFGINWSLSDRWAVYAVAGQTFAGLGSKKDRFRADQIGLGLSYRFSVPTR